MGTRYRLGRWFGLGGEGILFNKTLIVKHNVSCHPEGCFFPEQIIHYQKC